MNIFHSLDWLLSQNFHLITDVSNTASSSSLEIEMLEKYMKFLESTNNQLAKNFNDSITHLQFLLNTFLTVIGLIFTFVFGGSIWKAQEIANTHINSEVEKVIAKRVDQETDVIKDLIDKEGVISKTNIQYILVGNYQEINECKLLRNRQFKEVKFCVNIQEYRSINQENKSSNKNYNVIVIDFFYKEFVPEQKSIRKLSAEENRIIEQGREEIINSIIKIIKKDSLNSVLVIYVPSLPRKGLHGKIFEILDNNQIYFTPATNPVALIGRVVDAAQMAYALQHSKD